MRVSTYEIILPLLDENGTEIPDHLLFINGLYKAIDIVDKKSAEQIQAAKFDEIPLALKERLALRGHLTCKSEAEEIADMKLMSRIHRKIFEHTSIGLVIMPTYDCNFRCPYCYEQQRLKNERAWLKHTMSDEMIEAIFSAVKKYKSRGYTLNEFTFYGGEPFLKENLPIVRKIAEHGRDAGMKMNAITNGYDLDAFLDILTEFDFKNLQLTIDGVGELNNRLRIHKHGGDTYERILANMELALERGIGIKLRVNVGRENIHGMKALVDDLKARGFIDKENARSQEEERLRKIDPKAKTSRGTFYYYFKTTDDCFRTVDNGDYSKRNVTESSIIYELTKSGVNLETAVEHQNQYCSAAGEILGILRSNSFANFDPAFCSAVNGLFIIDPFGKIYPCFYFINNPDMEIGFVDVKRGSFVTNFEVAKWQTRTADLIEKCQSCPYCFICRGGCAARAQFYCGGNWRREYCGENKEIFNFVASRLIGIHWQKTHKEEMSNSLAETISRLSAKERDIFMTSNSQKEIFALAKKTKILSL